MNSLRVQVARGGFDSRLAAVSTILPVRSWVPTPLCTTRSHPPLGMERLALAVHKGVDAEALGSCGGLPLVAVLVVVVVVAVVMAVVMAVGVVVVVMVMLAG